MRFNFIYLLAAGNAVSCLPHSSEESAKLQGRGEMNAQDKNPHSVLKASAVAGLSLAGILAASIGATEYISSLYHRLSKGKIESQNETGDKNFDRDRQLVGEDIQDAGIDIVLDLIEKYAHERETAVMPAETSVGESERDEDSEPETATTTVEKSLDMALPLPRLPGHPPLSSFTEGASDKAESDLDEEIGYVDEDKKDTMNGARGYSFHPICDKLRKTSTQ